MLGFNLSGWRKKNTDTVQGEDPAQEEPQVVEDEGSVLLEGLIRGVIDSANKEANAKGREPGQVVEVTLEELPIPHSELVDGLDMFSRNFGYMNVLTHDERIVRLQLLTPKRPTEI